MNLEIQSILETSERAVTTLREVLSMPKSDVVRDAAIQRFEYCFELAWKSIRRCAQAEGLKVDSPAGAIRAAFQLGWIDDDATWLQMKDDRNLTSHTYDEQTAEELYMRLPAYLPRLSTLVDRLKQTFHAPAPRRAGFTLIELLVVVGIIGILVGLIVGVSGYANRKSANSKALSEIEQIKTALEEYRLDNNIYPDTGASLSNLLSRYNSALTYTDPWGNPYQYERSSQFSFRLWSRGPNSTNAFDDIDPAAGSF
jgi:type II secretion system protein G